jgi:hypothetical protein
VKFVVHPGRPAFFGLWKGVVMDSIEFAACGFLVAAAPLFEEEGDVILVTLVADRRHPFLFHRSGMDAAFAADDHPVDPFDVQPI